LDAGRIELRAATMTERPATAFFSTRLSLRYHYNCPAPPP
jgi:hypothetical protein